ncbi:MAG: glycosyl hydrolase family 65 protein [Solirubrobacterales bacterium]
MTDKAIFEIDPWCVRESELNQGAIAHSESIFALSNGHLGMRGNLDEGEPFGHAGTYLNGVYEIRPLPYAETAYGNPEAGETVLNVTDGKPIRLLVDDELFDTRYAELLGHERVLDFRAGTLVRKVHWRSPTGREVKISSTRIVSHSQRGVAAILYEVEPLDQQMNLVVQSELVANGNGAPDQTMAVDDPRAAAVLVSPLIGEEHFLHDEMAMLIHRTENSGIRLAAAMDHEVTGPDGMHVEGEVGPNVGRLTVTTKIAPGQKLRVLKYLAYGWSSQRSLSSVRAQVRGSLSEARHTGWEGLLTAQRKFLDEFWESADVEIDGDPELQQAIRFGLFHILQASSRAERRAIPAKGLTGTGYDGHAFWDTETFVLPVLTYTHPESARDALYWRHATLNLARERAGQLGLAGAAFPWRTIAGRECSGYWPASTASFHVSADIADAVERHQHAAGDENFEREVAVPILIETARLWMSLGRHDDKGEFRIAGVTGPDEYSALADNNVYTNLMAARNLRAAARVLRRHPEDAAALGATEAEAETWVHAASTVHIPYDPIHNVHPQAAGFTHHSRWDFDAMTPSDYPLLLHYPYFEIYRKQVVKQSDLVLALHLCGDFFTAEEKVRNFEYYEEITVRDSSLSACTQSIIAAETGHLQLAHEYLHEAALVDLQNLAHNTSDGLHMASLAGSWMGIVAGFGGFRDNEGKLKFAPRLPKKIERVKFRLTFRGTRLAVTVTRDEARYELETGETLTAWHHGEEFEVRAGQPVSRSIEQIEDRPRPKLPHGRDPAHMRVSEPEVDVTGALQEPAGQYAFQGDRSV